jgi:hypothetical protein
MKIEILAKRLAEKTNTPALFDFIMGTRSYKELPLDCMLWTGRKTISGRSRKMFRDNQNIPVFCTAHRRPMGQIQVNKSTEYVHRLIYKILIRPSFEFRMENRCGNPLCVNPKHWEIYNGIPEVDYGSPDWSPEEVQEAVDGMLSRYQVLSWDDVIANPLTMDCPHDMLRECLTKMNREHLTLWKI